MSQFLELAINMLMVILLIMLIVFTIYVIYRAVLEFIDAYNTWRNK